MMVLLARGRLRRTGLSVHRDILERGEKGCHRHLKCIVDRSPGVNGTDASPPCEHASRDFPHAQTSLVQHHPALHLRVVLRHQLSQHVHGTLVEAEETRGSVSGALPRKHCHDGGKTEDAQAARDGDLHQRAGTHEPGPEDGVDLMSLQGSAEGRYARLIMLAVAIHPNNEIIPTKTRVLQSCLHRGADPQVEGMTHDESAGILGLARRSIARPVVHNQDRRVWHFCSNAKHNGANGRLFIEGGHHDQQTF